MFGFVNVDEAVEFASNTRADDAEMPNPSVGFHSVDVACSVGEPCTVDVDCTGGFFRSILDDCDGWLGCIASPSEVVGDASGRIGSASIT